MRNPKLLIFMKVMSEHPLKSKVKHLRIFIVKNILMLKKILIRKFLLLD